MTEPRLLEWTRLAWRDLGWRDLGLACAVSVALMIFGNHGGALFFQVTAGVNPVLDPGKNYLRGFLLNLVQEGLPLVFAVRVADRAIADGISPWHAYPLAVLCVAAWAWLFRLAVPPRKAWIHWYLLVRFLGQAGTGIVIYALWRASQRARQLAQASETQRARDQQRLRSAQLLALQARVDPQLLFDSLRQVGTLQRHDPPSADVLLNDLIALLRAMLPRPASTGSTVEREFAVVDAWLRVTRALSPVQRDVRVELASATAGASLAPMLTLPLLRAVLDVPGADRVSWRLHAQAAGARLLVTLEAPTQHAAVAVPRLADLASLRERIASLWDGAAALLTGSAPPSLTLDLPLSFDSTTEGEPAADHHRPDTASGTMPNEEGSHAHRLDRRG